MTTQTMTTQTITRDETEIRAVLAEVAAAIEARDADRLMATYSADAVRYGLAPPLLHKQGTAYGDADGMRNWFATFDGPPEVETRDLIVTADGDVAFTYALTRLTATPAGAAESFTLWFRTTVGLRRLDGSWLITHEHASTPFYMDGSFAAAVDLAP